MLTSKFSACYDAVIDSQSSDRLKIKNMKNNLQKEIEKYFGYMLPSESSRYYSSAEILAMKDSLEYDDFLDLKDIQSNLDGDFTSLSDDEKEEAYEEAIEEIQKSYEKWISEQRISRNCSQNKK